MTFLKVSDKLSVNIDAITSYKLNIYDNVESNREECDTEIHLGNTCHYVNGSEAFQALQDLFELRGNLIDINDLIKLKPNTDKLFEFYRGRGGHSYIKMLNDPNMVITKELQIEAHNKALEQLEFDFGNETKSFKPKNSKDIN